MIFESQHPDLFDYQEEQVILQLVQDTLHFPPGDPAQFILPAPGELFVQTKRVKTD
jgi:hypothetical protein